MNRRLIEVVALAFEEANSDPPYSGHHIHRGRPASAPAMTSTSTSRPESEDAARVHIAAIQRVSEAICLADKPVIGAINGWAVGGGFEWAINCDFPIWAESAKAFFPELKWGMFVTGGATSLLPALVGSPPRAR